MHELSICNALLTQVDAIVRAHGADAATRIVLAVGPLSGIEPALLARAFEFTRGGRCAASATLAFETVPIRIRCTECGTESACEANRLLCNRCGGYRTQILSGDALLLVRVELSTAQPDEPPSYRLTG